MERETMDLAANYKNIMRTMLIGEGSRRIFSSSIVSIRRFL